MKANKVRALETLIGRWLDDKWIITVLAVLTGVGFLWSQIGALESFLANNGSSPLHWIFLSLDESKSVIDWPTGTRNLGKSIPMNLYAWLADVGVNLQDAMGVYIAAEIGVMLAAYYFTFRAAVQNSKRYIAFCFAVVVALTAFQAMNLARFGYPFIWGLYYSLVSAARILGIAFIFKNRPWSAAICFAIAMMIHPIMGGVAVLAVVPVVFLRGYARWRSYLAPAAVGGLFIALWVIQVFAKSNVDVGSIPEKDWYGLSQIFNFHWYPFYIGVFDGLALRHWIPFLSLMLLYTVASADDSIRSRYRYECDAIVLTLAVLTTAGLAVSYFKISPLLMKLSLHRSSDLLVVVAFIPVMVRLFRDFQEGYLFNRLMAAILLISPIMHYFYPGMPLLISLLYTSPFIYKRLRSQRSIRIIVALIVWSLGMFFLLRLYLNGPNGWETSPTVTAVGYFWGLLENNLPLLATLVLGALFFRQAKNTATLGLVVLISWGAVSSNHARLSQFHEERSSDMREMQLWARDNTPEDALFMVDPSGHGAFRDLSRRASYGTVREWLHSAWLYDSDVVLFKEGTRRAALLGLNLEAIYAQGARRDIYRYIRNTVSEVYYRSGRDWYLSMAVNEGVDYFVFRKRFLKSLPPGLEIVYENDHFAIGALAR